MPTLEPLLRFLGICRRAGKIMFGADAVAKGVFSGEAKLVLVARDASPRVRRAMENSCLQYGVTLLDPGFSMDELGGAIGRSATAAAAVTEKKMAEKVAKMCQAE
jgi:ribosomal protein L7Ae-like RNA K-turn-binding protein